MNEETGAKLRPPVSIEAIACEVSRSQVRLNGCVNWYVREYNNGWSAGRRGGESKAWGSAETSAAWDDGYLDAAAGRPKWHLAHCTNHDNCGEA